jgi:Tfp pilus assembly protein PilF
MIQLDLRTPDVPDGTSAADFPLVIQEENERRARGRKLGRDGILALLLGFALIACGVACGLLIPPEAMEFRFLPSYLFLGGLLGIYVGVSRRRLSRQYLAPNAEQLLQRDPRPPIVYLRPFDADDNDPVPPVFWDYLNGAGTFDQALGASEEEQLAIAMNELGPFIAIGKPYDTLPKLGAARIRISDQEWRTKVTEWVSHAQLIALRLGFTKGVEWEIAHILEHAPPEKLVLLLPFTPATGYDTFREQMQEHFKCGLPEIKRRNWTPPLSVCGLVYFSSGWEPHFVMLKRPFLNRLSRILDKIGSMGGVPILALFGPRPLTTLILLFLEPRNWATAQYKRAFRPVMKQLGLRWKHHSFVHLLKPVVVVPLLLGVLSVPIIQHKRAVAVQAQVNQGALMLGRGNYDQAIQNFTTAIQMSPKDEPALVGRGIAYEAKGNHAAAIQDLDAAIKMQPGDERALAGRGYAYASEGNYAAAIQDLSIVIQMDPKDVNALAIRAYAYQGAGNCAAAREDADAVIAIDPNNQLVPTVRLLCVLASPQLLQQLPKVRE